jgi:hypothetical protein
MADESYVQVAGDGAGKKIRNLVRTRIPLDGVPAANADEKTYIQEVTLTNADGVLLKDDGWRQDMLAAQRETNELLVQILDRLR